MWHLKTITKPVIVGTLGMIKKGQIKTLKTKLIVLAYVKYKNYFEEHLIS